MMLCVVLCGALLAQPAAAAKQPAKNAAFLARVEDALRADDNFLALHRGFLSYLDARPEVLAVEQAWWDVVIEPTVAHAEQAFDEALIGDVAMGAARDAAYDLLARDPDLRAQTEALQRVELTETGAQGLLSEGLRALRADPDLATRLLGGVAGLGEDGGALQALTQYLAARPGLSEELGGIFKALSGAPLAQTRLVPWWQQVAAASPGAAAYSGLAREFVRAPRRFWAWHGRELAWAGDAQARDWMRYLYRRARRNQTLAGAYPHYLRALYAQPEHKSSIEKGYLEEERPLMGFPPLQAPPTLAPLAREMPAPDERATGLVPRAPARPTEAMRPAMPRRPKVEIRRPEPRTREE